MIPFQLEGGALGRLRSTLTQMVDAGLDHAVIGDHVSFHGGFGLDGLIAATAITALEPRLNVCTSVYQLPLRHPVPVARQLSTIANIHPGRLIFGVGVGGDDRHEVEVCGVDPGTRGRRMDESLAVISGLVTGEPFTFDGEFFQLAGAQIQPAPPEPVTIIIGGRAEAAFRRTARWGHGYVGLWISPRRMASGIAAVADYAREADRVVEWQHALTVWCGFAADRRTARDLLARTMQRLYGQPFEKFEKYSPYGTPAEVAAFLQEYVEVGCAHFNLLARAQSPEESIKCAAEIKRLLNESRTR